MNLRLIVSLNIRSTTVDLLTLRGEGHHISQLGTEPLSRLGVISKYTVSENIVMGALCYTYFHTNSY